MKVKTLLGTSLCVSLGILSCAMATPVFSRAKIQRSAMENGEISNLTWSL